MVINGLNIYIADRSVIFGKDVHFGIFIENKVLLPGEHQALMFAVFTITNIYYALTQYIYTHTDDEYKSY